MLIGVTVVILTIGLAMVGIPLVVPLTNMLAKTGFVLVLGGLAATLRVTRVAPHTSGSDYHV